MTPPTLRPTNTCFDDALDALAEMVKASPDVVDDLFLVHGICQDPRDRHSYAHAWVEFQRGARTYCLFELLANGKRQHFATTADAFYREMQVQETTRYTWAQALAENLRANHYGPWVERYRELCADRLQAARGGAA